MQIPFHYRNLVLLALYSVPSLLCASPFDDFDGMILGQGVNLRAADQQNAAVLGTLTVGQKVRILSTGDPVTVPGIRGEYPWVEVALDKKRGWVFGKFVFDLSHDLSSWYTENSTLRSQVAEGAVLKIKNREYIFGLVSGQCYPDQQGTDEAVDPGQCAVLFLLDRATRIPVFFKTPGDYCGDKIPNHRAKQHMEGARAGSILYLVDMGPFGSEQIAGLSVKDQNASVEIQIATGGNGYTGRYTLTGVLSGSGIGINKCIVNEWDEIR